MKTFLSAHCHKQPVFAADYFYDDYGDYYLVNLPSRDCFCDYNCKDRGDCCDDIATTCEHFFSPRVSSEVTFDRGVVKYFHAGVGKTFEEALALCAKEDARLVQPESVADMEALQDALGWTGKARFKLYSLNLHNFVRNFETNKRLIVHHFGYHGQIC